jgi:hypothetical protein
VWGLGDVRRVVYRLDELVEHERIVWCEGEKDCDRLWKEGIAASTSPSGANSFRDDYARQLVEAAIREVVVIPDHDRPGHAYATAAARAMQAVDLKVRWLSLPGLGPTREKHGPDVSDWLDAGHTVGELRTLADEAPMFNASDALAASEAPADSEGRVGELRREGLDLVLVWPDGTRFSLTAIHDGREGVRGELTVTQRGRRLSWGSWSLASTQARETLRKKLHAAAPDTPWGDYLEEAAWRFTQAAREGEPLVTLSGAVTSPTRELVPRFLYEGEPTLLYADGDTGKSLVALTLATAVQGGSALPSRLTPLRAVPAAYLDWETSRDTIEGRLAMVAAGLGIRVPPILYKRMTRPLVDEAAALAAEFARRRIGLVVVDSKMFAVAGGDGAAFHEPITAFYGALRLFAPAAVLVLNHVTNSDARTGVPARPFGGAFAFNGPRLIWEAKRDHEVDDATAIVFTCRKANNLPRKPEPFGLTFHAEADAITVAHLDPSEAAPQTVAGASLVYRLKTALDGNRKTVEALADELRVSGDSIRRTLNRNREKGFVPIQDSKPQFWALASDP